MKSGRFLKMRDVEILKSYHPLQGSRDPACHSQLKDFEEKGSQAAYGERPGSDLQEPAKVKVERRAAVLPAPSGEPRSDRFPSFSLRPFRRRRA